MNVKACIKLYITEGRPRFHSGYRPIFNFGLDKYTSGRITLIDSEWFYPGEEGIVYISFLTPTEEILGKNFDKGTSFVFGENSVDILGEGIVLEIISVYEND